MVIKYNISPYPSLLEDMVLKVWEAQNDNPGAEVYTLTIPQDGGGGHNSITPVTINGLDKVVHVIRLYSAISANLLHNYTLEPVADVLTIFDPIQFKIGVPSGSMIVPSPGDQVFSDGRLQGLDETGYTVFRNNYGYLIPGIHYTADPGSSTIVASFALIAPDQFNDGEEFTIQQKPVLSLNVHDSVVSKWFGGFLDITADTNYNPSHLRKLFRFKGNFNYHFVGSIPIGYAYCFQNFTTNPGTVFFDNATLLWGTTPKSSLIIPAYCEAAFVFDGTNWNVIYVSQSTWVNAASLVSPGQNVAAGIFAVGNPAAGSQNYLVNHNLAIPGDYMVLLSIKGNTTTYDPNSNMYAPTWYHHPTDKANNFYFSLREAGANTQDISITWLIVKL